MKAEKHFQKGERFEQAQARLDPAPDWESIIEICYMAAHHYLIAGVDWRTGTHPSTHAHSANANLLKQLGAPGEVQKAWDDLDVLRSGGVYGARTNGVASAQARSCLAIIKVWVEAARP